MTCLSSRTESGCWCWASWGGFQEGRQPRAAGLWPSVSTSMKRNSKSCLSSSQGQGLTLAGGGMGQAKGSVHTAVPSPAPPKRKIPGQEVTVPRMWPTDPQPCLLPLPGSLGDLGTDTTSRGCQQGSNLRYTVWGPGQNLQLQRRCLMAEEGRRGQEGAAGGRSVQPGSGGSHHRAGEKGGGL